MYVNPARVWMAKSRRKLTLKTLAEAVGESPGVVSAWVKKRGYALDLSEAQAERLVFATGYPLGFFTGGDEEEDFDSLNSIGRQIFGSEHKEIG